MDQNSCSEESSDDNRGPEESDETSSGGDVDQAVDCRGFQKLLDLVHGEWFIVNCNKLNCCTASGSCNKCPFERRLFDYTHLCLSKICLENI